MGVEDRQPPGLPGQCSADTGSGQRPVRRCDDPDFPAEPDRRDEPATREAEEQELGIMKGLKEKGI